MAAEQQDNQDENIIFNKVDNNIFGLDTDSNELSIKEGMYRFALNIINSVSTGDKNTLSNELSNNLVNSFKIGYTPFSYCYIEEGFIIVFLIKDKFSEIGYINAKDEYITIINDENTINAGYEGLNFKITNQCNIIARKKLAYWYIYWVDGLGDPKYCNITNPSIHLKYPQPKNKTNILNSSSFILLKNAKKIPHFLSVYITKDGAIPAGSYSFAISLLDVKKQPTTWLNISLPVRIYNDNIDNSYSNIRGSKNVGNVLQNFQKANKSINVLIDNIDENFPYYRIAVLQTNSGNNNVNKVLISPIYSSQVLEFKYQGNDEIYSIGSLEELIKEQTNLKGMSYITQIDNRIILANQKYKQYDYPQFQKYASKINTSLTSKVVVLDDVENPACSKNPNNTFIPIKEYMLNEVYVFSITYIMDNLELSPSYLLIGPESATSTSVLQPFISNSTYLDLFNCNDESFDFWGKDSNNKELVNTNVRFFRLPKERDLSNPLYFKRYNPLYNLNGNITNFELNYDKVIPSSGLYIKATISLLNIYNIKTFVSGTFFISSNNINSGSSLSNDGQINTNYLFVDNINNFNIQDKIFIGDDNNLYQIINKDTINNKIILSSMLVKFYHEGLIIYKYNIGTCTFNSNFTTKVDINSLEVLEQNISYNLYIYNNFFKKITLPKNTVKLELNNYCRNIIGFNFSNIEQPPNTIGFYICQAERRQFDKHVIDNCIIGPLKKNKDYVSYGLVAPRFPVDVSNLTDKYVKDNIDDKRFWVYSPENIYKNNNYTFSSIELNGIYSGIWGRHNPVGSTYTTRNNLEGSNNFGLINSSGTTEAATNGGIYIPNGYQQDIQVGTSYNKDVNPQTDLDGFDFVYGLRIASGTIYENSNNPFYKNYKTFINNINVPFKLLNLPIDKNYLLDRFNYVIDNTTILYNASQDSRINIVKLSDNINGDNNINNILNPNPTILNLEYNGININNIEGTINVLNSSCVLRIDANADIGFLGEEPPIDNSFNSSITIIISKNGVVILTRQFNNSGTNIIIPSILSNYIEINLNELGEYTFNLSAAIQSYSSNLAPTMAVNLIIKDINSSNNIVNLFYPAYQGNPVPNFTPQLLYGQMVVDNEGAYGDFLNRPFYKCHNNPYYFTDNLNNVNIFNGDTETGPINILSSTYNDTKSADREKAKVDYLLAGIQVIGGLVLTIVGVAAAIPTAGVSAALVSSGIALTAKGIADVITNINTQNQIDAYRVDYQRGLHDCITDYQVMNQIINIDNPPTNFNPGDYITDGGLAGASPILRQDDTIRVFTDCFLDLMIQTSVNISLKVGFQNATTTDFVNPLKYFQYLNGSELLSTKYQLIINDVLDYQKYLLNKWTFVDPNSQGGRLFRGNASLEYIEINDDYSKRFNEIGNNGISLYYDVCNNNIIYPNRVYWSLESSQEESIDNYGKILPNDYTDIPSDYGEITNIYTNNTGLFIQTKTMLYYLARNTQYQITSDFEIYLGSGKLFSIPVRKIEDSILGVGGTSDNFSGIKTRYGYIFVSEKERQIYIHNFGINNTGVSNNLKSLSDIYMSNFFYNNLKLYINEYFLVNNNIEYPYKNNTSNPLGVGFISTFDNRFKRLIITKKDYLPINCSFGDKRSGFTYYNGKFYNDSVEVVNFNNTTLFENKSFTISFNFDTNTWMSFHSYIPNNYIYTFNYFYSIINNKLYKHNMEYKYGNFYGTYYKSIIEFISNNVLKNSILNTLILYSQAQKYDYTNKVFVLKREVTFNKINIYNKNQSTGDLDIEVINEANWYQGRGIYATDDKNAKLYITSKDNKFYLNGLKSYLIDSGNALFLQNWDNIKSNYYIDKIFNKDNINYNKDWYLLEDLYGEFLYIRLSFDNSKEDGNINILYKLSINTNKIVTL